MIYFMGYILKEFRRHFWRSFFSMLGYAVSAVFILIILCITGSNKNDSLGILQNTGTHFIAYIPTDKSCCTSSIATGTVFAEGVNTMMMDHDLLATIKNTEGIRDAAPCLLYKMYNNDFREEVSIAGIDTTSIATNTNVCARTNLIAGKYLSERPDELVAEQSFAVSHNLSLGDTLDVFGGRYTLAGIINSGIKPVKADFYAPIGFVRSVLKDKLQCTAPNFDMNIILAEVDDARIQNKVIEQIKNLMYKFSVSTYNCYEPASKVMSIINKSSTGLTMLIFLFLVVFSAKTQLTALIERMREIGILKSLGWSDMGLSLQIILISFIQAIIGVTIGLLAGIAVVNILKSYEISVFQNIVFRFQYIGIPFIYVLSLLGALIASLFPIARICRSSAGDIIQSHM